MVEPGGGHRQPPSRQVTLERQLARDEKAEVRRKAALQPRHQALVHPAHARVVVRGPRAQAHDAEALAL